MHYFTFRKPGCAFKYLAFTKLCRNFAAHLKQIKYVISRDVICVFTAFHKITQNQFYIDYQLVKIIIVL